MRILIEINFTSSNLVDEKCRSVRPKISRNVILIPRWCGWTKQFGHSTAKSFEHFYLPFIREKGIVTVQTASFFPFPLFCVFRIYKMLQLNKQDHHHLRHLLNSEVVQRIDLKRLLAASSASRCLGSKRRRSLSESARSESTSTTAACGSATAASLVAMKWSFSGFQNSQEFTTRFEMFIGSKFTLEKNKC